MPTSRPRVKLELMAAAQLLTRILVPLDGSPLADRALGYAEVLAARAGAELLLVQAIDTWAVLDGGRHGRRAQEMTVEAESRLAASVERLKSRGQMAASSVEFGEAAMVIAQARQSHNSDLIVMSTHGRGGLARLAYGSVAERVLRLGACPVLLIPPDAAADWNTASGGVVVVPVDGSQLSEEALSPARGLADIFGASLLVLQVVEPPAATAYDGWNAITPYEYLDVEQWVEQAKPYANDVARRLQDGGARAEALTLAGYPAATIDQEVRRQNALAVVMASHGRSGIGRMVLGSVAQGVVQRTRVPVLVVTPAAMRDEV